jgi:hypothetical protein
MAGRIPVPGNHVLFLHNTAAGLVLRDALISVAMTEPNPTVTLITIKTNGDYQYRAAVPHRSRRLDEVQSCWCWPEEYTAEVKARNDREEARRDVERATGSRKR